MDDVGRSNVSTRQPTPGLRKSGNLFDKSLENFKTNLPSHAESMSYNGKPASPPSSEANRKVKQPFADSVASRDESESHGHSQLARNGSKFLQFGQKPSWQNETAVNKPPLENRRTLYNLVAGRQNNVSGMVEAGESHQVKPSHMWGRAKKESVADIEEMLADMHFSGVGSRKVQEGYVHFLTLCIRLVTVSSNSYCSKSILFV